MKAARRGMTLDIGDLPMVDVMCARAELARLAEGIRINEHGIATYNNSQIRRFIDLFNGIGGFHLGLAGFGMECAFACDMNPLPGDLPPQFRNSAGSRHREGLCRNGARARCAMRRRALHHFQPERRTGGNQRSARTAISACPSAR